MSNMNAFIRFTFVAAIYAAICCIVSIIGKLNNCPDMLNELLRFFGIIFLVWNLGKLYDWMIDRIIAKRLNEDNPDRNETK